MVAVSRRKLKPDFDLLADQNTEYMSDSGSQYCDA